MARIGILAPRQEAHLALSWVTIATPTFHYHEQFHKCDDMRAVERLSSRLARVMSTVRRVLLSKSFQLGIAIFIAVAGLLFIRRALFGDTGYDNFRILWLAGKVWASGQNAYGEAYIREYEAMFGAPVGQELMYYPPSWFPIAVPLSFLSYETARIVWRMLSLALAIAAAFLACRIAAGKNPDRFWPLFLIGAGYVMLMQPTFLAIVFGQTSPVICFGLASVFYGLSRKSHWALTTGLLAVALKPNVGAVVYAAVSMMSAWRWTLVRPLFFLMLAAAPALLPAPAETLSSFLSNLGRYFDPAFLGAAPENMVGAFHFAGAPPYQLTANALVGAAVIASLIVFRLEIAEERKFVWMTLVILLLVPLHSYDVVMVAIPAIFIWSRGIYDLRSVLASVGLLICLRPLSIAQALNIAPGTILPESGPLTLGLFLVAGSLLIPAMPKKWSEKVPDGTPRGASKRDATERSGVRADRAS